MKTIPLLILLLALSTGPGCMNLTLPPISAESFIYDRKDTFGGTHIVAKGVVVDDTSVRAERVTWVTTYPFISLSLSVEKYERKIESP